MGLTPTRNIPLLGLTPTQSRLFAHPADGSHLHSESHIPLMGLTPTQSLLFAHPAEEMVTQTPACEPPLV